MWSFKINYYKSKHLNSVFRIDNTLSKMNVRKSSHLGEQCVRKLGPYGHHIHAKNILGGL